MTTDGESHECHSEPSTGAQSADEAESVSVDPPDAARPAERQQQP